MAVEIKVPGVGESVQEGMIESWKKQNGEWVERDEVLLELETDKATVELVAEASGVVSIGKEAGEVVTVGEVIGQIDDQASKPAGSTASESPTKPQSSAEEPPESGSQMEGSNAPSAQSGPAAQRMAAEHGINLEDVSGSAKGGRVTKDDLSKHIAKQQASAPSAGTDVDANSSSSRDSGERTPSRKPMSMLRRRIAERLLGAQRDAAILTTFNEVDMTQTMELRKKYKESFQEKHGVKLGFMGFFLKASATALIDSPEVNAYIDGDEIEYHNYCDIGVAVSTNKGLMVPVVRNVQDMSIADIEKAIGVYAAKARDNKISLDDLSGGTFTVSNGGVFGSLLSTPILNPPQSAILGMHKTQMRPMVMEDGRIEARPMMYLALSYDHRIIDGKEAVTFLVKIKQILEDPARLILGL